MHGNYTSNYADVYIFCVILDAIVIVVNTYTIVLTTLQGSGYDNEGGNN